MFARGGAGYLGLKRQLGCRERLTSHECRKHGRARSVTNQRCDFDHVCGGDHIPA